MAEASFSNGKTGDGDSRFELGISQVGCRGCRQLTEHVEDEGAFTERRLAWLYRFALPGATRAPAAAKSLL